MVIAQVGDGIVTLSQLKREMKERVQTLVQNGRLNSKPPPRWSASRTHRDLINEQLLLQGQRDGLAQLEMKSTAHAASRQRNGFTSMEKLCEEMKKLVSAVMKPGRQCASDHETGW
jgi:hypothetical protein